MIIIINTEKWEEFFKNYYWDFPSSPVVKNLPCNTGDADLISDWKTKIPRVTGQLSPFATTTEPTPQLKSPQALTREKPNDTVKRCRACPTAKN